MWTMTRRTVYEPGMPGRMGSNAGAAARAMGVGGTVPEDRPVPAQRLLQGRRQPGRADGSDLVDPARLPRILVLLPQGRRGAREALRSHRVVRLPRLWAQRQAACELHLLVVRAGRRRAAGMERARRDRRPRAVA